jgi:putative ABC transport system ATP-binding protein
MPLLEILGLKKGYPRPSGPALPVVDIPQFSLGEGQTACLRGKSGCGKTTFLNLIAGILRPDEGRVSLQGQDLARLPESRRDRLRGQKIGYLFQSFNLLQGYTALENVEMAMRLGRGLDKGRARAMLERVGLAERLDHKPSQLSVGQQQRVALARALANQPCLVLADEPTGNLDPEAAEVALRLLKQVCAETKAALLLVSHDPRALSAFSEVMDLERLNRAAGSAS